MTPPSEKRPLTAEDLFKFQMIDDPQVSPDGTQVAFVKTWLDETQNSYRANIFVMDLASKATRQLTYGEQQDTRPRWSPDGQVIVYFASVDGSSQDATQDVAPNVAPASDFLDKLPQLHIIPSSGGTAAVLTDLTGGVQGHTWSPDGKKIAFTTLISSEDEPLNTDSQDLFAAYNRDVLVTTRVRWKSDAIGLVGDYFRHIAVVDVDTQELTASSPRLLTRGETDFNSPKWSPDGSQLAVVGNLEASAEWQRKAFIYLLDVSSDTPEPKELVGLEEMRSNDLAFSPDGTQLAVCGHDDPIKGHYGLQKLWLIGVADGSKTCVSEHIDMSFGDFSRNQDMRRYGGDDGPRWAADGRSLLLLTNVSGSVNLASFSLNSKTLTPLTEGDHAVFAFSADASHKTVVTLITDNVNPCDLFQVTAADASGYKLTHLTSINQD
ncbi:MAG: DPP IV N-terminal domain-containing protein, partial [Deinococcota bacterium]